MLDQPLSGRQSTEGSQQSAQGRQEVSFRFRSYANVIMLLVVKQPGVFSGEYGLHGSRRTRMIILARTIEKL